jgi:hypothetical protein
MKKLILILSLAIFILIFIASCTTIDERYTGKRIKIEPAMHPDDYQSDQYYQPSYYYDPYFSGGMDTILPIIGAITLPIIGATILLTTRVADTMDTEATTGPTSGRGSSVDQEQTELLRQ